LSGQARSGGLAIGPEKLRGIAFSFWAFAVGAGVCIHEWQRAQPPLSLAGLTVVLAVGVLLRPSSVPRVMALLATMGLELLIDLPDVFNHTLVIGVVGITLLLWWLLVLRRSPADARDPALVYSSIAPFMRVAFVVVLYAAAFAKLNTGFLDPATTCAVWIIDAIPFVTIPASLAGLMIVGAILVEFAIPTSLLFRRTRPLGIALGIWFGVVTALAGHAPFAGFGWSFYLFFIPPGTLGRVAATVGRRLTPQVPRRLAGASESPLSWILLGGAALIVMGIIQLASVDTVAILKRYGATFAFCGWMVIWTVLLAANWRHWLTLSARKGRFGAGHPFFVVVLVLILVNAASPYIGLKTRFSFTMFSNLQTEPGRWNHVVLPEAVRVFDLQKGLVRFDQISDPALAAAIDVYSGPKRWSSGAVMSDEAWVVLLAARRLVSNYPDATVRYEYEGEARVAAPVASDPILGGSVPFIVQKLGGFRPVDNEDTCQL
jgi:hypothetical protein